MTNKPINQRIKEYYLLHGTEKTCFKETHVAKELAAILRCKTEINAPLQMGRIDLLSADWLLELKKGGSTAQKNCLGQLICYKMALDFKGNLGIGLIGNQLPNPGVRLFCKKFNISIFFYNLNSCKWSFLYDNRSMERVSFL